MGQQSSHFLLNKSLQSQQRFLETIVFYIYKEYKLFFTCENI